MIIETQSTILSKEEILNISSLSLKLDRVIQRDIHYSLWKNYKETSGKKEKNGIELLFPSLITIGTGFRNTNFYSFKIDDDKYGYYFEQEWPEMNLIHLLKAEHLRIDSNIINLDLKEDSNLKIYNYLKTSRPDYIEGLNPFRVMSFISTYKQDLELAIGIKVRTYKFNKVLYRFNLKTGSVGRLNMVKDIWESVSSIKFRFI